MTIHPPVAGSRTAEGAEAAAGRRSWWARRQFPLLATLALVLVGMVSTTWGASLVGEHQWSLPHDLWRTLVAAHRLGHLDLAGLYLQPTALITFPGAALILLPAVAAIDATGLGLAFQSAQNPYPTAWLVAGPYEIALSAVVLFAADAIAERWGVDRLRRALLAAAGTVALWSVSVRWGHPEDAVALGLLMYGVLALSESRMARSALLIGAGIAVQPLVLLGVVIVLAVVPPRRWAGFIVRAAIPGTLLLGAAAATNWTATMHAVTNQPNWPTRNHPTPWTTLAPQMSGGGVAAGPARLMAILLACGCAVIVSRRWRKRPETARWSAAALEGLLWWIAVALALRCVFEPVMVAYYLWPALALALVAASSSRPRLLATAAVASILTFVSQVSWRGAWVWWGMVVLGLSLALFAARRRPLDSSQAINPSGSDRIMRTASARRHRSFSHRRDVPGGLDSTGRGHR